MIDKDYAIIPWIKQSSSVNEDGRDVWLATACWREYQWNAWSRWLWLARIKAIRRVVVNRLFRRFIDTDELYPRWFRILEGGW